MKKIVNPNAPFSEAQQAQLREKLGEIETVAAGVNFPAASDGGLSETAYGSAINYPQGFNYWVPTGLGTGAAAVMATLHGSRGSRFPEIVVFGKPPTFDFVGTVNLDVVRNVARATRYGSLSPDPIKGNLVVLNFSHPITETQRTEIAKLLGIEEAELEIREGLSRQYAYSTADELVAAVREQVNDAKVSSFDWQATKIVVNLPAHSAGAMIALAEMHGRMGYFPSILRIEKVGDVFSFTEVVKLDELRLRALTAVQQAAEAANAEAPAIGGIEAVLQRLALAIDEEFLVVAHGNNSDFEVTIETIVTFKVRGKSFRLTIKAAEES